MFKMSATTILFMALSLVWISDSNAAKTHYMKIDRIEPKLNKEWVAENMTISIKKHNKNEKRVNISVAIMQDVKDDLVCEIKVYQEMGAKYMKAPADFPATSCCGFIEKNTADMWSCVRKFSNFPEKCVITKGTYEIKDLNVNDCEVRFSLPPNTPENYKFEFQVTKGRTRVFSMVVFGTMKKIPKF